jgi:hypothetical protein
MSAKLNRDFGFSIGVYVKFMLALKLNVNGECLLRYAF